MNVRLLVACGLAVLGLLGCTSSEQSVYPEARALTEATSYASPERQRQLKAALAGAGIPYRTEIRDGQEFAVRDAKDSAAAKAALESPLGPELPAGRHMGASKELRDEFESWLRANNVSYFTKSQERHPLEVVKLYRFRALYGGAFVGGLAGAIIGGQFLDSWAREMSRYLVAIAITAAVCAGVGLLLVEALRVRPAEDDESHAGADTSEPAGGERSGGSASEVNEA